MPRASTIRAVEVRAAICNYIVGDSSEDVAHDSIQPRRRRRTCTMSDCVHYTDGMTALGVCIDS